MIVLTHLTSTPNSIRGTLAGIGRNGSRRDMIRGLTEALRLEESVVDGPSLDWQGTEMYKLA
jgi:hypothetical protein